MADNYLDIFSQEGVYFFSSAGKVLVTRTDGVSVGYILLRCYQTAKPFLGGEGSRSIQKEE